MKRNCLLVLNPRYIEKCINSIKNLKIDKVFFRAFTEIEICSPINDFIKNHNYDNYLIVSDDVIATNEALEKVCELLEKHEAATGYCLVSQEDTFVNVTRSPLRNISYYSPIIEDYNFYYKKEIEMLQDPIFVTWFGGWCLTGFSKKLWLKFPFRVSNNKAQSDYATCLAYNNILLSHKDSYVEHIKEGLFKTNYSNFLVGNTKKEIIYEIDGNNTYLETSKYNKVRSQLV